MVLLDLIHGFLNIVAPPFTFFSLLLFLPPYQFFKYFLSILGYLFSEDVAGKVVIITGASSGIGEVQVGITPVVKVEDCAKAIVNGACRRERYITVPAWFRVTYLWKVFCPEVVEWILRLLCLTGSGKSPEDALSKKILNYIGVQKVLYPENIRQLQHKTM